MHRDEWRDIARTRQDEARTLLAAGKWSGAYYLAGYAVECGLKSIIAKQFSGNTTPDKKLVMELHTHKLDALVRLAGLDLQLRNDLAASQPFEVNWLVVKDWSEVGRYSQWTQQEAQDMVTAVSHRRDGVMKWVRANW